MKMTNLALEGKRYVVITYTKRMVAVYQIIDGTGKVLVDNISSLQEARKVLNEK